MSRVNTSSKTTKAESQAICEEDPETLVLEDEFDSEMLAAFKVEADELLEVSECQLLILESEPTDATALKRSLSCLSYD